MSAPVVLIAAPAHAVLLDGLTEAGYHLRMAERITQEHAAAMIADCVGVITSTRLHLDRTLLDAAPRLRWIGRMGSGMEVIDLAYASARGIQCFSSPEGNCNSVGEHALGMLLGLTRRIVISHQQVKQEGVWLREQNRGIELEGKTLGIIGFGHTGQAFARKLAGFDMQILAYDKYKVFESPKFGVTMCAELRPIYERAEIVSFHVPLQADTRHYFNQTFLREMRRPFILVNTSRGSVVDLQALRDGLSAGWVTGACLDVLEGEPLDRMGSRERALFEEISKFDHVVFTPHIGGYSAEALYKMSLSLWSKIVKAA